MNSLYIRMIILFICSVLITSGLNTIAGARQSKSKSDKTAPISESELEKGLEQHELANKIGAVIENTMAPFFEKVSRQEDKRSGDAYLEYKKAESLRINGDYETAVVISKQALEIGQKTKGEQSHVVAGIHTQLASIYSRLGLFEKARQHYRESIAILKPIVSKTKPVPAPSMFSMLLDMDSTQNFLDLISAYSNYAGLLENLGGLAEAEKQYQHALNLSENSIYAGHKYAIYSLLGLAYVQKFQGRYDEAEMQCQKALRLLLTNPAEGDTKLRVRTLFQLFEIYAVQKRYRVAEEYLSRAQELYGKVSNKDSYNISSIWNGSGELAMAEKRYVDAERNFRSAIEAIEGEPKYSFHLIVLAEYMTNLGSALAAQRRYVESITILRGSLLCFKKAGLSEQTDVARTMMELAHSLSMAEQLEEALDYARQSTSIREDQLRYSFRNLGAGRYSKIQTYKGEVIEHIAILWRILCKSSNNRELYAEEAFEVGQISKSTTTATTVQQMADRFSSEDSELQEMLFERQKQIKKLDRASKELSAKYGLPRNLERTRRIAELQKIIEDCQGEIDLLDQKTALNFPRFREWVSPTPVTVAAVQEVLQPEEALLSFVVGDEQSFLFVVLPSGQYLLPLSIGGEDLHRRLTALRAILNPERVEKGFTSLNLREARELYKKLFGPAATLLKDSKHLIIANNDNLSQLPFGILLTKETSALLELEGLKYSPTSKSQTERLRKLPWLMKKYAVTLIPGVSTLPALRQTARPTEAEQPFIGFGNPILLSKANGKTKLNNWNASLRGVGGSRQIILPALPETEQELRAICSSLDGDPKELYFRSQATESLIRSKDLSKFRVVGFSTHALTAKELIGTDEPVLVLSTPDVPTQTDDGMLASSEIAEMRLDAEWVLLLACNTAAPDGNSATEGMSGLSRAFFFAGARSILVSLWQIESNATVLMTNSLFSRLKEAKGSLPRAEALRLAMLDLIESQSIYAHPAFWAPFIVVGEGGPLSTVELSASRS